MWNDIKCCLSTAPSSGQGLKQSCVEREPDALWHFKHEWNQSFVFFRLIFTSISGGGRLWKQLLRLCSNRSVESLAGVQEAQSHRKGGNQMGLCIILHGECSLGACWRIYMYSGCPGWSEHWLWSGHVSPGFLLFLCFWFFFSARIRMIFSPRNPWPSWPVMHMSCGCGIHSLPLQAWVNTAAIPGMTANAGGRKRL